MITQISGQLEAVHETSVILQRDGLSFEVLVPAAGETDTAYDALVEAQNNRTPVDLLEVEGGVISTDGLKATRAVSGVFGGDKGQPLQDASTRSFETSFVLNSDQDVPQFGTTSGGAFVPSS